MEKFFSTNECRVSVTEKSFSVNECQVNVTDAKHHILLYFSFIVGIRIIVTVNRNVHRNNIIMGISSGDWSHITKNTIFEEKKFTFIYLFIKHVNNIIFSSNHHTDINHWKLFCHNLWNKFHVLIYAKFILEPFLQTKFWNFVWNKLHTSFHMKQVLAEHISQKNVFSVACLFLFLFVFCYCLFVLFAHTRGMHFQEVIGRPWSWDLIAQVYSVISILEMYSRSYIITG